MNADPTLAPRSPKVHRHSQPDDFKPMPAIKPGGGGIRQDESGIYRVTCAARLADAVVVLHTLEKQA
jgi:phage-related protein